MKKTSIAIAIALASIGNASIGWGRPISDMRPTGYPVSNRHTGKAAERRQAKRRRRAK